MPKRLSTPSRKEQVAAQYSSAEAAADYARAHDSSRPSARHFRSRLWLVQHVLTACPGGDLLDAGCGPGVLVHALLEARPHDFRITALDQSPAMVEYCLADVRDVGEVCPAVGQLEALPFGDAVFDVALATGALEYTDARTAISEISRVTRPGGLVVVTMLNPLSPYRVTEWFVYWPARRLLGAIERSFGVPAARRHGARATGIRAVPAGKLRRLMAEAGLRPIDLVYYDLRLVVPPIDRLPLIVRSAEHTADERTITRGWRRWMGTGYLIAARRC
jgi:ubiquinone/menaquinone biosynthesis C-methylase UbiE